MKKNKSKIKRRPLELKPEEQPIDPRLLNIVGALKALTTCYNLFNEGFWPKKSWKAVEDCHAFLKQVHADTLTEALKHPEAYRLDELKIAKENRNAQSKASA